MKNTILLFLFFNYLLSIGQLGSKTIVPDDFPSFHVPGYEKEMELLRKLFYLQFTVSGSSVPLWDEWMPMSTLWPAIGEGHKLMETRREWANSLSSRFFNAEGYIVTEQHDGLAHAEGWPFPLWTQGGGVGWHFRSTGIPGYDASVVTPDGWIITGGKGGIVNSQGWEIKLIENNAVIQSPLCFIDAEEFPWLRLNWWAVGLEGANCYIEWTTEDNPTFSKTRRAYFSLTEFDKRRVAHASWAPEPLGKLDSIVPLARTMIPVYRIPTWKGKITGFRIGFDNQEPLKIVIKSFHVAYDSRHSVNNLNFIRGCHDYFMWTNDIAFLRSQIGRIRTSMHFIQREFDTRKRKCLYTTWPGHEGTSGVRFINGDKTFFPGEGIGSNYWDLLPFGGEDALGSIYYYDALRDLAKLEEAIIKHPEWCISTGADSFSPEELRQHAMEVRDYGRKRFWNEKTGRFGTVDLKGTMHDYGFTFLNNEAVYFGFATSEQEKSIYEWLNGLRMVNGDTSTGDDIYYWRFGPRSNTRDNKDYYPFSIDPEWFPWGKSVQNGGAILAWSYYDLMMRIKVAGPDDAEKLLMKIIAWYKDTQDEGGFRAYYQNDPSRGTLQGDNVGGAVGVDKEFIESILVPQVMLYGFLGFTPGTDGFRINPMLPENWPSLTITRIHFHEQIINITVTQDKKVIIFGTNVPVDDFLTIELPEDYVVYATGMDIRKKTIPD